MPKYQNTQKFIQPIRIGGTRILVKPDEIISIKTKLDLNLFPFLKEVDDDVQEHKNVDQVIKKQQSTQNNAISDKDKQKEINDDIYKKLTILKEAIDVLNSALSNLETEVYEKENFIIDEENK